MLLVRASLQCLLLLLLQLITSAFLLSPSVKAYGLSWPRSPERSSATLRMALEPRPGEPQDPHSISARLWQACKEDALNSLYHPFVLQLATGALPKEAFQAYITQDAFFLQAFARAYGHALTKAPDMEGLRAFHGLIGSVLEELTLHEAFAEEWGVNLAEAIDREGPLPATRAYTSFLLQIGGDSRSTCADVLAAMAPCMRLYAFLGTTLAAAFPAPVTAEHSTEPASECSAAERASESAAAADGDTPYRAWIAAYSSPEFGAAAATVERLLDKYAAAPGGVGRYYALLAHYRTAMALEYAFFDASGLEAGLKGDPAALERARAAAGVAAGPRGMTGKSPLELALAYKSTKKAGSGSAST
eukprot:TRINITY_DN6116_c0_g1_i2.p1 TRINITY_DN6116_c0_g1~~TRINITY_DN6116_c0_g1_i2.p1  ORF type:complete len:369 (+),score=87.61 TRINITY_DN6116_c0_g1_i2:29-1108(+)